MLPIAILTPQAAAAAPANVLAVASDAPAAAAGQTPDGAGQVPLFAMLMPAGGAAPEALPVAGVVADPIAMVPDLPLATLPVEQPVGTDGAAQDQDDALLALLASMMAQAQPQQAPPADLPTLPPVDAGAAGTASPWAWDATSPWSGAAIAPSALPVPVASSEAFAHLPLDPAGPASAPVTVPGAYPAGVPLAGAQPASASGALVPPQDPIAVADVPAAASAGLPASAPDQDVPLPVVAATASQPTAVQPAPAVVMVDEAAMQVAGSAPAPKPAAVSAPSLPGPGATDADPAASADPAPAAAVAAVLPHVGQASQQAGPSGRPLATDRRRVPAESEASTTVPVAAAPAAVSQPIIAPEPGAGERGAPTAARPREAAVASAMPPAAGAAAATAQPAAVAEPDHDASSAVAAASVPVDGDAGDAAPIAMRDLAVLPRVETPAAVRASEPPRPDPNPMERAVATQVSRAIVRHLPDGGASMVMRLTPPELGTVRVEFLMRDGAVTARLVAEDDGVRQALDRALPQIRSEVRGDHPTVDITVDRSDQRQSWQEQHARQEHRGDQQQAPQHRRRDGDEVFSLDGSSQPAHPEPAPVAARALGGRAGPRGVDAFA